MARAARDGFCRVYRAAPHWLLAENLPAPLSMGSEQLFRRICPPPTAPPPPSFAPVQGQCPGVLYRVTYRQRVYQVSNPNGGLDSTQDYPALLVGPIGGVRRQGAANNSSSPTARAQFYLSYDGGRQEVLLFDAAVQTAIAYAYVTQIVRPDGQPDTCTLPRPIYPRQPPPQPGDLSFNIDIDLGGNTINVPFTFAPTVYPPDVNIGPNVFVNVAGNTFNFNAGGVDITIPIGGGSPITLPPGQDPRPQPPPPKDPSPKPTPFDYKPINDRFDRVDGDFDTLFPLVDLLLDCDRCIDVPVDDSDYEVVTYPASQTLQIDLPRQCAFCTIELTEIPRNAKTQSGIQAPDVFYAGWAEFGANGSYLPREPIHFTNSCFTPSTFADGFAFTLAAGYRGVLRVYFNQEDI